MIIWLSLQNLHMHCFSFSWDLQSQKEELKTVLMQNFGGTTKSIMEFLKSPIESIA